MNAMLLERIEVVTLMQSNHINYLVWYHTPDYAKRVYDILFSTTSMWGLRISDVIEHGSYLNVIDAWRYKMYNKNSVHGLNFANKLYPMFSNHVPNSKLIHFANPGDYVYNNIVDFAYVKTTKYIQREIIFKGEKKIENFPVNIYIKV